MRLDDSGSQSQLRVGQREELPSKLIFIWRTRHARHVRAKTEREYKGMGGQFQLQLQPQTRPQITDRVSRDPLDRAQREREAKGDRGRD